MLVNGSKIRQLRQARGIQQDRLAYLMGVGQSTMSRVECGSRNGRLSLLIKLAKFFNVNVDELLL